MQAEAAAKRQMLGYPRPHLRAGRRRRVVPQDTIRHLINFFDPEGAGAHALQQQRSHRVVAYGRVSGMDQTFPNDILLGSA